jgi:hypothetical protein
MTPTVSTLPVSVVVPTYNRAHLVARAIVTALGTLLGGDELIVVDDGSTDHTPAAVARYSDRVRYVRTPHAGAGVARNVGIEAARNPLVAFLDSDDEWWPDKTRLQRAFHEARPDVLFSFTNFGVRLEDGTEVRRYLRRWQEVPRPWTEVLGPATPYSALAALTPGRPDFGVHVGDLFRAEMDENYVATFTMMARKDLAKGALRFAPDLRVVDDWECFARLARAGPAAYLDTETAWQHGHPGPRLTRTSPYVVAGERLLLLERIWGADPAFMARHGERLRAKVEELHVRRARWLLRRGRPDEARAELAAAGGGPWTHRLLARLPGPFVRGALRVLRGPADDRTA